MSSTVSEQPKPTARRQIVSVVVSTTAIAVSQLFAFLGKGRLDPFLSSDSFPITSLQVTIAIAVLIQYLVFIPAYLFQTEKFYDLTGSLTYITCTLYSLFAKETTASPTATMVSVLVFVWAIRLGSFLFTRVLQDGKDGRFDRLKPFFWVFLMVWSLQGLWVTFTALAVFTINCSDDSPSIHPVSWVGFGIWIIGFGIEVVADHQKKMFRANPDNKGKWIEEGLWYYSRHPNYFGEILLWFGMFVLATPIFTNTQWAAVISPVFVCLLITKVSGVPLLENRADEKWGNNPEYLVYKQRTSSVLILPKGPLPQGALEPSQEL